MSMTFASSTSCHKYAVNTGDTLSIIANKFYGDGSQVVWKRLYEANNAVIGPDPAKIASGMVLLIPAIDLRANCAFVDVTEREYRRGLV
jgi:nucleoid-associated protein YgaU